VTHVDLPPAVAEWLLKLAVRELRSHVRNGGALVPAVRKAMEGLAAAADVELDGAGSASRTAPDSVGLVTAHEAAALVGVSDRYIQRLARDGRVRCRWVGVWLVDVESVRSVLRRTT
jgi:hypothetical protein